MRAAPLAGEKLAADRCGLWRRCTCIGIADDMADVGIIESKRRPSEYVDRVERGEVVLLTHRGRPGATLDRLPRLATRS